MVAIFGLGWGASFGAGMAFGRRSVSTLPAAQAAAIPGAGQAQTGGAAGQSGQAAQGGPGGATVRGTAIGTVQSLDGQTLTLSGPNNQAVKVALTDQTQFLKMGEGTAADLTTGATVTVQPVTIVPAGARIPLGAGGGGPGAAGGQGAQRQGGQGAQGGQARQGG
jgi:hypothetical protein